VVDDSPDSREVVTTFLQDAGASVLAAGPAAAALDIIQREDADVLLADIAMPGEDGYSLLQKVRTLRLRRKARIPAIAFTSFTGVDHVARLAAPVVVETVGNSE
jgi:CheY-like chemotaxis protein